MTIEEISAYATAIAVAIGVIVTAVVKGVQALAALKVQLESIGRALGLGEDETIRQSIEALRIDTSKRIEVLDKRVGTIEVKIARLDCDPDDLSGSFTACEADTGAAS